MEVYNENGSTQAMAYPTPTAKRKQTFMLFAYPTPHPPDTIRSPQLDRCRRCPR